MQPFSWNTLKAVALAIAVALMGYLLPTLPHWFPDLLYRTAIIGLLYLALIHTSRTAPDLSNFLQSGLAKIQSKLRK